MMNALSDLANTRDHFATAIGEEQVVALGIEHHLWNEKSLTMTTTEHMTKMTTETTTEHMTKMKTKMMTSMNDGPPLFLFSNSILVISPSFFF